MPLTAFIQQHEVKLYYTSGEKMVLEKQHEGWHMIECRNSTTPNDEELLRLALDEEPLQGKAKEHLEQCVTCQQRLALCKRTNNYLRSTLYRYQCPTSTKLNLYCTGRLKDSEEKSVIHHITVCPLCTDEAAMIYRTLANFEMFPEMPSP